SRMMLMDRIGGCRSLTMGSASQTACLLGLGTGIVKALARQIDAYVETSATPEGTVVSIVHATFSTEAGRAAQKAPISFVGSPAAVLHAEVPIASQKRDS